MRIIYSFIQFFKRGKIIELPRKIEILKNCCFSMEKKKRGDMTSG